MPTAEMIDEIDEINFLEDLNQLTQVDIPEKQAKAFIKLIAKNNRKILNKTLTKTDIKELEWKIEGLRKDTFTAIESLRKDTTLELAKTNSQIESLRKDTTIEIQKSKNELLIWMFGMLTTFTGIIFSIVKFVK